MRTLLICHDGYPLDQQVMARWLASFSHLVGLIVLRENKQQIWRRIRRELSRSGPWRLCDVIAFRLYYSFVLSRSDRRWEAGILEKLSRVYPPLPSEIPIFHTHSPNTSEAKRFIENLHPDLMIARCKTLLKEDIFALPSKGTLVMHPGICPEYRNAHGCFWALANDDLDRVGMTLLRIDRGVDTGPVYGYFTYKFNDFEESHIVIQNRVVFDNLERIQNKIWEIYRGEARQLDTSNRSSAVWGQPRLTSYIKWKRQAQKRHAGS
jgi:methionyl-tRNA formyltransferase